MKKRLCFIIITIFTLVLLQNVSASSIDYELVIDNNKHCYETITHTIEKNTTNSYLEEALNNKTYFDKNKKKAYIKSVTSDNNNSIVVLKTNYNCSEIKQSKLLNECFKEFLYEDDGYKIDFYTDGEFYCINRADNIKVSITSNIDVLIDTANEKVGNKYIWNKIDKDFSIELSVGKYNPNDDVLPPIANDDEIVPDDDMDEWPDGDITEYSHTKIAITGAAITVGLGTIIIIFIKKNKKSKYETDDISF